MPTMVWNSKNSKLVYAAWVAFMPGLTFVVVFAALCAWECTVGPWLMLVIAPVAVLLLWLVSAVVYMRWTHQLAAQEGASVRRYIAFSILWAPVLASFSSVVVFSAIAAAFTLAGF